MRNPENIGHIVPGTVRQLMHMSSPFRGLVNIKKSSKNIQKCHEGEIDLIFSSLCFFNSNVLMQFK